MKMPGYYTVRYHCKLCKGRAYPLFPDPETMAFAAWDESIRFHLEHEHGRILGETEYVNNFLQAVYR